MSKYPLLFAPAVFVTGENYNVYARVAIDCAFGVQEESERKPNPFNVFRALEHLGVKQEHAVYVGDSEVDVQTATNAGLSCIGVTWGYRDKDTLLQAGADMLIDTPKQLLTLL